jgi:hypothetical protein
VVPSPPPANHEVINVDDDDDDNDNNDNEEDENDGHPRNQDGYYSRRLNPSPPRPPRYLDFNNPKLSYKRSTSCLNWTLTSFTPNP